MNVVDSCGWLEYFRIYKSNSSLAPFDLSSSENAWRICGRDTSASAFGKRQDLTPCPFMNEVVS